MKAKVTRAFWGRADDAPSGAGKQYLVGTMIEGELARTAVRDGNAEEVKADEPQPQPEPAPEPAPAPAPKPAPAKKPAADDDA